MLAIPHSSPAAAGTGVPHQVWPTSYSVASHHTDRCSQIPSPCSTARNGRSSGQAASQWVGQQGAGEHAGLLDQVGVAWQHELSVATPVSGDGGEPHCHGLVERQAPAGTGGATVGPHLRKAGAMTAGWRWHIAVASLTTPPHVSATRTHQTPCKGTSCRAWKVAAQSTQCEGWLCCPCRDAQTA